MATQPQAPDRNLAMELVRTTEAAAMAASRWMGRGDKLGADGAAVEAMRVVLSSVQMDGIVVIGEGEKDNAPMLFNGERIGDGSPPLTDIAVDPIDGTTPTALGRGGALAVIAVSERGTMFDPGPCVYMEKLAVGPRAKGACDIRRTPTENLNALSEALGRPVRDLTAVILDRPRHQDLIAEVRTAGARIRLITDGDVAGAIATGWPGAGTDILFGIGGTPEGVLAAAALKCMGGEIQGRLFARDEEERARPRGGGLRPRGGAEHRRPRAGGQLLLRRDGRDRRRASPRRPVPRIRRHHAEPGDALQVGDAAHDPRQSRAGEAVGVQLRLLRLIRLDG